MHPTTQLLAHSGRDRRSEELARHRREVLVARRAARAKGLRSLVRRTLPARPAPAPVICCAR